ncbi:SDR family NAD(P)-dependent oxidoreductase [Mucilaginibacter sp.]|uniref:SDR family NAD(P)-dependent oxidoreductase n=1 Tax=Mucilaginibacter sp. TaxID=1882438 RepID=UPI0035BC3787
MPLSTTIITGATSGIGKQTALELAKKDHAIYMLVRDVDKGEKVKEQLIELTKNKSIYVVECDLADLESVRRAALLLKGSLLAIHVLINNAGGIYNECDESKQGYEMTFAVNHLGHFVLLHHLLPLLERGHAKVINLTSEAHRFGKPRFKDMNWKSSPYSPFRAYANAKLYNIYFTRSIEAKYGPKGLTAFAAHPGIINTNFGEHLTGISKFLIGLTRPFMKSVVEGARTSVYLATTQRIDAKSGKYVKDKKVTNPSGTALDEASRNKLWQISVEMAGRFLSE